MYFSLQEDWKKTEDGEEIRKVLGAVFGAGCTREDQEAREEGKMVQLNFTLSKAQGLCPCGSTRERPLPTIRRNGRDFSLGEVCSGTADEVVVPVWNVTAVETKYPTIDG